MSPLPRGANVALSRENPSLATVDVTVDWGSVDPAFDSTLSMAALLLGEDGKVASGDDLVWFNTLAAPAGAAWEPIVNGERIRVSLASVPPTVHRIAFILSIDAVPTSVPRTLAQLPRCVTTVTDADSGATLVTSEDLSQHFRAETACLTAELYRRRGEWKFKVIAQGYAAGLRGVLEDFGVPR